MSAFELEVVGTSAIMRAAFANRADAERELATVTPKLGRDFFGLNDKSESTHTINHDAGKIVVALEKVVAVHLVDRVAWEVAMADDLERKCAQTIAYEVRRETALLAVQPSKSAV